MRLFYLVTAMLIWAATASADTAKAPRVLVMGDSFMTSNASKGHSIPAILSRELDTRVQSTAVAGASFGHRLPISGALGFDIDRQYRRGNWDIVVMNGGGNDLWLGCGCLRCERRLEFLIGEDGSSGAIPETVRRAWSGGAALLYVGYLRSPGLGSPIDRCLVVGNRLEARIARMADVQPGVHFLSLANLVPDGDASYHAIDRIHPSVKGSEAAGKLIAAKIRDILDLPRS
jgi:hypothetical protein